MKSEIFIIVLLFLSHSSFAQPDSIALGGDTARLEVKQKVQTSSLQDFDELMVTPPQKLYLPIKPQSMPLTLYSPAYGTLEPSAKNNGIAPDQNLDNFYLNYNASLNRMFKRSASDKVFSIMGIGATAFVWGMVVKQAIEGKPNPNANPPKQEPKPQRKPL